MWDKEVKVLFVVDGLEVKSFNSVLLNELYMIMNKVGGLF